MKWKIPLIAIALMLFLVPSVFGVVKTVDCLNENTLRKYTNLTYCNATNACMDYNITEYVTCEYGCDDARMICTDFSGPPGTAVPFALFIIIELIALGMLVVSFISDVPTYKLVSSLVALILLFSLGLLSTNIMTAEGAIELTWLSWLNIGLAWIGVVMFLVSIFYVLKESTAKVPV